MRTGLGIQCEPCFREHRRKAFERWPSIFTPPTTRGWPWENMRATAAETGGVCQWCGRALMGAYLCSDYCDHEAAKAARRVEHEPRACEHCGELFTPTRSDARYCCTAHRVAAHRAKRREAAQA